MNEDITSSSDLDAIKRRWDDAAKGPWRAVQIPGFGPVVFIVSDHPGEAWYRVVAVVHNAGSHAAAEAMAAAREDVPCLAAEVGRLRATLAASAQSFDDLVTKVWQALGHTHEPPADAATLVRCVAAARREGAAAMKATCAEEADAWASDIIGMAGDDAPRVAARIAAALRTLPLPEVTP